MQGVYFTLRRRGLDAQEASRNNVSLVFSLHGQKQGKTELFTAADLRKTQENQGLSVIRMDKPEVVYLFSMQLYRTTDPSGYSLTILSSEKPHFR